MIRARFRRRNFLGMLPFFLMPALSSCDRNFPEVSRGSQPVSSFEGETITYIVATQPGGGYDTYARLIARYMERHLGGVRIRIRNVPGAGNIVGANQLFVASLRF